MQLRHSRFHWGLVTLTYLFCTALISFQSGCGTVTGRSRETTATTMPSTIEPTATATMVQPTPATLPGWHLVFDDEFNGSSVDTMRWDVENTLTGEYDNCCRGFGNQSWLPDNVVESGGQLHIVTKSQQSDGHPYTSGAITTQNTFQFTYGRIDVRAKLPRTSGLWPTLWLLDNPNSQGIYAQYYEVDFMEAWMGNPHLVHAFFHYDAVQDTCDATGIDFTDTFHTYTLIWSPGRLQWLIDGVTKCVDTQYAPDVPMYLIMCTAIDGVDQSVNNTTRLPQSFDIDYVRIWQSA